MAIPSTREVKESPVEQGADESWAYTITTTPWGSTPTSISCAVYDITDGAAPITANDVTSTVMPTNSPSASGDVITLSPLKSLTAGHTYRVEVKFTISGNIAEPYFIVNAKY